MAVKWPDPNPSGKSLQMQCSEKSDLIASFLRMFLNLSIKKISLAILMQQLRIRNDAVSIINRQGPNLSGVRGRKRDIVILIDLENCCTM